MNRPTVLIVDDDPAMRVYLGTALRLGGFDVVTKPVSPDDLVKAMFDALACSQIQDGGDVDARRTVLWLCPACGRVGRESHETGHPMTSEMRNDAAPCLHCADITRGPQRFEEIDGV